MRMILKNTRGFGLIEVLISTVMLSVFSLSLLGLVDFARGETDRQYALTLRDIEMSQFFMLVSDPRYVGALAGFEQNLMLNKCLVVDSVVCNRKDSYPLTAYDLSTSQPSLHLNSESVQHVQTELSFQVHCPLEQESCDQADYINVTVKSSIRGAMGILFSSTKVVSVSPTMSKVVTLVPNTTIEDGRPLNLIIFVDGSNSMSAIQASFKTTLEQLFVNLQNMNSTVTLYALNDHTVDVNDYSAFSYMYDSSMNRVPLSAADVDALPNGQKYYKDFSKMFRYGIQYVPGSPDDNNQSVFSFTTTMTAGDRAATVSRISRKVDQIFADGLVNDAPDAPLCGMVRILEDIKSGVSALKMDPTTYNVFMFLTNENDESKLYEVGDGTITKGSVHCVSKFTQELTAANMPVISIYGTLMRGRANIQNETLVDGVPTTSTIQVDIFFENTTAYKSGDDCKAGVQANYSWIRPFLPKNSTGNYTVTDCLVNRVTGMWFGEIENGDPTINYCADLTKYPLDTQKIEYKYMMPGTCSQREHYTYWSHTNPKTVVYKELIPTDLDAHDDNDLPLGVFNLLSNNFDLDNFYFQAVINPSSGVCPLSAESAYGVKYEALAQKLAGKSQVIPICSSDYASKILELPNQFTTMAVGDFTLAPAVAQNFTGLDVLRGSTVLYPTMGVDFTLTNNILVFSNNYLQSTDIVRVYTK